MTSTWSRNGPSRSFTSEFSRAGSGIDDWPLVDLSQRFVAAPAYGVGHEPPTGAAEGMDHEHN